MDACLVGFRATVRNVTVKISIMLRLQLHQQHVNSKWNNFLKENSMIDKVQKIREEVEKLQNELIQEKRNGFGSDVDDACILELQNVLTYIDSLQEEPVSIWHNASEIPQEGSLILREIGISQKGYGVIRYSKELPNFLKHCEDIPIQKWAYIDDILNLSNIERTVKKRKEIPVSENLKEAADNALGSIINQYDIISVGSCLEMFRLGAKWQKEKEYTCYEEAFEDGAKWKKEKTIDKACKWIEEKTAKYLVDRFVDSTRVVGIDTSIIEDFRKDMEDE